jgi:ribosomal protein L31
MTIYSILKSTAYYKEVYLEILKNFHSMTLSFKVCETIFILKDNELQTCLKTYFFYNSVLFLLRIYSQCHKFYTRNKFFSGL